jgi:hypothetical protein
VNRLDTVHKIIRFGKNGPRVLDLFIALSTIDKGEQTKIEHGRRWFGATFVGVIQGAFEDQRVWIDKDTRVNDSLREQNKRPGRFEINEGEMQVFLKDFIARKAQIMLNVCTLSSFLSEKKTMLMKNTTVTGMGRRHRVGGPSNSPRPCNKETHRSSGHTIREGD